MTLNLKLVRISPKLFRDMINLTELVVEHCLRTLQVLVTSPMDVVLTLVRQVPHAVLRPSLMRCIDVELFQPYFDVCSITPCEELVITCHYRIGL